MVIGVLLHTSYFCYPESSSSSFHNHNIFSFWTISLSLIFWPCALNGFPFPRKRCSISPGINQSKYYVPKKGDWFSKKHMIQSDLERCNKLFLVFVKNRFLFFILDVKMKYHKICSIDSHHHGTMRVELI